MRVWAAVEFVIWVPRRCPGSADVLGKAAMSRCSKDQGIDCGIEM